MTKNELKERTAERRTEWERVSQGAKLNKLRKRMASRDIIRELRLESLGEKPLEVLEGIPLSDVVRSQRKELEWNLLYPKRTGRKAPIKRMPKGFKVTNGSKRTEKQFLYGILMGAKSRAKERNIPFDLKLSDITIPKVCPVLGIPIFWGDKQSDNTPSIDRVIPEKGYVLGNCHIISMKANRLKNNATVEELKAILEYITGHSDEKT
jgi:hypothetical protein